MKGRTGLGARVDWILDSMADLGHISRDEANVAKKQVREIKFIPRIR